MIKHIYYYISFFFFSLLEEMGTHIWNFFLILKVETPLSKMKEKQRKKKKENICQTHNPKRSFSLAPLGKLLLESYLC